MAPANFKLSLMFNDWIRFTHWFIKSFLLLFPAAAANQREALKSPFHLKEEPKVEETLSPRPSSQSQSQGQPSFPATFCQDGSAGATAASERPGSLKPREGSPKNSLLSQDINMKVASELLMKLSGSSVNAFAPLMVLKCMWCCRFLQRLQVSQISMSLFPIHRCFEMCILNTLRIIFFLWDFWSRWCLWNLVDGIDSLRLPFCVCLSPCLHIWLHFPICLRCVFRNSLNVLMTLNQTQIWFSLLYLGYSGMPSTNIRDKLCSCLSWAVLLQPEPLQSLSLFWESII